MLKIVEFIALRLMVVRRSRSAFGSYTTVGQLYLSPVYGHRRPRQWSDKHCKLRSLLQKDEIQTSSGSSKLRAVQRDKIMRAEFSFQQDETSLYMSIDRLGNCQNSCCTASMRYKLDQHEWRNV